MRSVIFVFAYVFASTVANAQNSFQNLINVSTTSPEAASIGKFGNIPVSYSTGVPNISVPVYEINIGKIRLPVSLDYHAGGIRVDEVASSIGLGWALNGVGVISRNMVGWPDESAEGYLNSPSFDSLYNWHTRSADYGTSIETKYARYLVSWTMYHEKETEPDVFSYTINGQSGKFIFKKDGSIMQIPKTNNRIVKTGNDFTITDENGVVYIFDQKETTEYVGASTTPYYTSTWRLSKMIDANTQDTIYFNYDGACDVNVSRYENFGHSLGYAGDCGNNNTSQFGPTYSPSTVYHHNELFPKEIVWRGGKISFNNTCGRQDKASEKRLDEINIYADQNSQLKLIKRIKLFQSYFFSDPIPYGTVDEKNYRLRLDSVGFMSTTDAEANYYRMTYNTSQPMAPRQSYAQDKWGFNNGQFGNSSLMPTQTVSYYGTYYTIGAANRESDGQAMQACTINSIEYPTKGKTVFEFEPHQYYDNTTYIETKSVQCDAYGSMQQTSTTTFTVEEKTEGYRFTVNISSYNYPDVSDRPRVRITDITTGQLVTLVTNMDPDNSYSSGTLALNVTMGHTYSIETNIYTNNSNVYATANITWVKTYVDVPVEPIGGGLRVKTVANYDVNGNFINKDVYKYNENGIGKLLTDAQYLAINYEIVKWRCGPSTIPCMPHMSPTEGYVYHANSVYPATQFSGSPVLYNKVTKSQVNAAGNAINGKSCYYYDIVDDWPAYASSDYGRIGVLLIDNGWKNGFLKVEEDYKYNSATAGYDLVHSKENNYQVYRADTMMGLKITTRTIWLGGCYTDPDLEWAYERFKLFRIPTYSGAMLLQSTTETTWDNNNNKLVTTRNFYYDDTRHIMPTKSESLNSKAEMTTGSFKYPHDLASSGNVYQKMVDRNIISPVVEEQESLNGVQQSLATVHYADWFGDTKLLLPQKADQQIKTNPVETKIRFNQFDGYGNILQQQKENDFFQSYIWDYHSVYPVAQCSNAGFISIAYTSFEADGTGNWNIGSSTRVSNGVTGDKSFSLVNGSISKPGLSASMEYIVSYWSTGGPYSVSGSIGNAEQGKTITVNGTGWTFFQHRITGVTTIAVSGNANIDELRLHPKDARMTTYTYHPLTGMTSKCDEGNHLTFYEYDGFGRLSIIRDEDGNILKKLSYRYADQ